MHAQESMRMHEATGHEGELFRVPASHSNLKTIIFLQTSLQNSLLILTFTLLDEID